VRGLGILLAALVALTLLRPAPALALDSGSPSVEPQPGTRSALTFALTPMMSFGEFTRGETSRVFTGLELGGRIGLSESWALSPFLGFAWETPSRSSAWSVDILCSGSGPCEGWSGWTTYSSQLGEAGVGAQFHPGGGGFWLAPRLGALMLRDTTEDRDSRGTTTQSSWYHAGFEFSAGAGYDWHLGERFALTFAGRVGEALFPWDQPGLPNRTPTTGPVVALALGGWFGVE
jgi:hypothetical protein